MKASTKLLLTVPFLLMPWLKSSASELEVLHWWTSPGEKQALAELQTRMDNKGYQWEDFAIIGGGGSEAINVLKSRIISGNPPAAAQIKGTTIQKWSNLNLIADVDQIAKSNQWDALLPESLKSSLKFDNKYVAAPLNIHRINWMWVNPKPFAAINKPVPATWQQLIDAASLLQKKGYQPLALGNEDWQYSMLFENVLLATQGADYYRKALVELNDDALSSKKMVDVFELLSEIRAFLPPNSADRKWDSATRQLIDGTAAIQFSGDWVKGEISYYGKQPGTDILCLPAPQTVNAFIYTVDTMVMFPSTDSKQVKAQNEFAKTMMEAEFQTAFNQKKGSIPIRQDISSALFDQCAQASMAAFKKSDQQATLVPSMVHSMAVDERVQRSFFEVLDYFFKHPTVSAEQAAKQLATAIKASH
ncbi:sugar ABC transporter substrate-binding protein [Endozoicomonas sp. OPT23]|uniref:ABC transporter substrate-binding protein n=1 Tax=Endozoicomonas sp. OPT23 TaxID=2072845 RepID=UPI00129BA18B|nr:ABC transporter substrate-binding protein [Endozoicomonas sp. OPT23]MRI35478.1 sugar ABC transporter substrate-binding protein [Endozoicomonas sp. OPT23]